MRDKVPDRLEKGRVNETDPRFRTDRGEWYGRFVVKSPTGSWLLLVVSAGDPETWVACGFPPPCFEHVSVSVRRDADGLVAKRCPTWDEMAFVKDLCWSEDEAVVQYHPPKADYVNWHPHVLHLWKPVGVELPRPPSLAVGPKPGEDVSSIVAGWK